MLLHAPSLLSLPLFIFFPNPNPSRTARRKIRPWRGSSCSLVYLIVSAVTCLPPPRKESSREGENRARPSVPLPQLRRASPSITGAVELLLPRRRLHLAQGERAILPDLFPSLALPGTDARRRCSSAAARLVAGAASTTSWKRRCPFGVARITEIIRARLILLGAFGNARLLARRSRSPPVMTPAWHQPDSTYALSLTGSRGPLANFTGSPHAGDARLGRPLLDLARGAPLSF